MEKTTVRQRIHPEEELVFERERLLNLIDSKIKRKEMDAAKGVAEELFKTEVKFALLKKTRILARYNNLLLRMIFGLISVLFFCTAFMVLNIKPAFSLLVEAFSVLGIISAVVIDSLLVKKFEKTVRAIMEVYETRKQFFIEKVLTHGIACDTSEDWQRLCTITAIE
jgi:hypothetical protein